MGKTVAMPGVPSVFARLAARFDPEAFDAPTGRARLRLEVSDAHLICNSMGGRVALEVGFRHPGRVGRIVGLAPALAWRRGRRSCARCGQSSGYSSSRRGQWSRSSCAASCQAGATAGRRSAPTRAAVRPAVRLGPRRPARADRLRPPRSRHAPGRRARRVRLRTRAPARGSARDAHGDQAVPGGRRSRRQRLTDSGIGE
jgi:pimeloyl-ACP methyl ester carboxylesterase